MVGMELLRAGVPPDARVFHKQMLCIAVDASAWAIVVSDKSDRDSRNT